MDAIQIVKEQVKAYEEHKNFAVVTITHSDGSTPRKNGKMLVFEDGKIIGTIGGGAVEVLAIRDAKQCIVEGASKMRAYDLTPKSETGMTCGGNISVMIETFVRKPLLVMCGAGHVGGAVLKLARFAGFETLLLDDRREEDFEDHIKLADQFHHVTDYEKELQELELPTESYVVIATHGHGYDGEALAGILRKSISYIGMIGSRRKINAIFENMQKKGFSKEELEAVYTPIGLNLGGETPEEIAISIMAEILMIKNGKNGEHMRVAKK